MNFTSRVNKNTCMVIKFNLSIHNSIFMQFIFLSGNDEDKEKKMILARVSLGEMCVLQRENEDMSFPPCKDCNFDNCIHGRRYDSVIGISNSRNFIIYERSQAYPEYIITYE